MIFPLSYPQSWQLKRVMQYYEALQARIDRPDDRTMYVGNVMARLNLPVRSSQPAQKTSSLTTCQPRDPLELPDEAQALFKTRDNTERSLRGVFGWAVLFLQDLEEMRRTRYAEADLFAAWGYPRVQAHDGVVKALLRQLDDLEGEIRRVLGGSIGGHVG